tara:strand:+ start:452 stop:823 length:372 start_codon:yes stop_codon:yes gene_type:complete
MHNINLKFSSYTINIKLRSNKTASAIKNILPFKSIVKTWGEEIYFEIPIEESLDLENDAKDIINVGEIAYWIEGKCIAIGYGKTPISKGNEIKLAARTNIWGDALLNIKELNKIKDGDEVVVS